MDFRYDLYLKNAILIHNLDSKTATVDSQTRSTIESSQIGKQDGSTASKTIRQHTTSITLVIERTTYRATKAV
jgi:hypothetical protein